MYIIASSPVCATTRLPTLNPHFLSPQAVPLLPHHGRTLLGVQVSNTPTTRPFHPCWHSAIGFLPSLWAGHRSDSMKIHWVGGLPLNRWSSGWLCIPGGPSWASRLTVVEMAELSPQPPPGGTLYAGFPVLYRASMGVSPCHCWSSGLGRWDSGVVHGMSSMQGAGMLCLLWLSLPLWLCLSGGLHSGQVAAALYLHMAHTGLLTHQA